MKKYLFLKLEIRCGEYEFTSADVHTVPKGMRNNDFAENYAKGFYFSEMEEDDRTYYFNGDEVAVQVLEYAEISTKEYNILRRYL